MSLSAREQLTVSLTTRYREARRPLKEKILDEFTAATGYHRKYAISLLKGSAPKCKRPKVQQRRKPRRYNEDAKEALIVIWKASNQLCSKRLVPFLPELLTRLERNGHLSLSEEIRQLLLRISTATVDRLLSSLRHNGRRRGFGTTRSGAMLKRQIPIRTFADWDDLKPGFLEGDLVAHCGTTTYGSYLSSLTLTDVATTWTECFALLMHGQEAVLSSLEEAQRLFPFPILGLDTDNGTEFINTEMLKYCRSKKITFTRSRPYKKNDQCHVEQKNGSIVRRMVGYDRFEGRDACRQLAALYGVLRLYNNFFQPSMKLVSKERKGSRVHKKYDQAQTPYQRVLTSPLVNPIVKESLRLEYARLDPVQLLRRIERLQDSLWQYAHRPANWIIAAPMLASVIHPTTPSSKSEIPQTKQDEPEKPRRTYRMTKKPRKKYTGPRYWRTQPDAFAEVWGLVEFQLEQNPHRDAALMFQQLQIQYPGRFKDGQVRTLQRRVKAWRETRNGPCPSVILPAVMDQLSVSSSAITPS